jgi:photosystem I subunit 12
LLQDATRCATILAKQGKVVNELLKISLTLRRFTTMPISDTQVYIALVVALIPGILAWRLATELYK